MSHKPLLLYGNYYDAFFLACALLSKYGRNFIIETRRETRDFNSYLIIKVIVW